MSRRLTKLASDREAAVTEMRAISDAAADRDLTEDETAKFEAAQASIEKLDADIEREEALIAAEKSAPVIDTGDPKPAATPKVTPGKPKVEDDPRRGFRSHREFLMSVIDNHGYRSTDQVQDERLQTLAVSDKEERGNTELAFVLPDAFAPSQFKAAVGSDEQGEYGDTVGGFAVPTTRIPGMLSVGFEGDPTAGLTMNLPMETPAVEIMARTDKDHSTSVAGGFTVARRSETEAFTSSRLSLEMISLKATALVGLAYATEELLTDSVVSFAALIESGFREQFGAKILDEKIRGQGGDQYLGYLNSGAKVEVSKETNQDADTIVANNVIKMAARSWGFGNAVWVANHDTRPQLAILSIPVGTSGVLIYQPSERAGFPDMLWGRPVLYTEYAPTLGDAGDISLVNFSQYLEGIYEPIQGASSVHVRFENHERTFKLWTRNAGAPWWRAALTPNTGTDTLSPIVTLAARA